MSSLQADTLAGEVTEDLDARFLAFPGPYHCIFTYTGVHHVGARVNEMNE
jgi:hypothetical protein